MKNKKRKNKHQKRKEKEEKDERPYRGKTIDRLSNNYSCQENHFSMRLLFENTTFLFE
jgi:hypothetical protein